MCQRKHLRFQDFRPEKERKKQKGSWKRAWGTWQRETKRQGQQTSCKWDDNSEPQGGQDLSEEDSEDVGIRGKLMQEEDPEDDHMVWCSMSTISITSIILQLGVHSEVTVAERRTAEAPN